MRGEPVPPLEPHVVSPGPSTLARLQTHVKPAVDQHLSDEQGATIHALATATTHTAAFKHPLILNALTSPWDGMLTLEQHASGMTTLASNRATDLSMMLDNIEIHAGSSSEIDIPMSTDPGEHITYIISLLDRASQLRERALANLTDDDRAFLFVHARYLTDNFSPQIGEWSDRPLKQARDGFRFTRLVAEEIDFAHLINAAEVLTQLSNPQWLSKLETAFDSHVETSHLHPAMTGEIKSLRKTPFGLLVIGGTGQNTYELNADIAVVVDLGGNDIYRGTIASASDVNQSNRVVIDLSGNDQYHSTVLGLATGRLGVGFLFDRSGNDEYRLAPGSGGAGFAGVGLLLDSAGNDHYWGSKLTQGAAVGGAGVLIDEAGDDTFTSFGYSIGFGGPLGTGTVIDGSGNDRYQCGDIYSSGYNATDAPESRPGDPLFQYTGFCLGVGSGIRMRSKNPEQQGYSLAGGMGLLLDLTGNDQYQSANFSQGLGYFYGAGTKLDLAGNDIHNAARYGHGASAHYGVGLFIDSEGDDHYGSTGPGYNGATAWDRSVAFSVDAGGGNDVYDLSRSTGLGRADHNSFSLFIDEGGNDQYQVPDGLGVTTDNSISGFFDLGGCDDYVARSTEDERRQRNGGTVVRPKGGLFIDRAGC